MTEVRKSVLRTVRLDDDVWKAIKELDCSLNQYLRSRLLLDEDVEIGRRIPILAAPPAIDVEGTVSDCEPDVKLDAVGPELSSGRGKASTETFSRGIRPKGDAKR